MSGSTRAAFAVGLLLVLTSSVPIAVGYAIAPADRQFMGIVSDVPDWAEYLAWMRAFATLVVIENPLTCEPQAPAFFNLQWLILGRLAAWISTPVALEIFRILTAVAFLVLTWRVAAEYFSHDRTATWLAWWLINGSAGLGWIWVVDKYLFGRADARFPLDIYIAEPLTFQNMTIFPHFLIAAALLLLTFRSAAAAIGRDRYGPAYASGVCALVLGLTHAYDLIIVYGVLGIFLLVLLVRDGWSWFRVTAMAAVVATSAGPPVYFAYLTSTDPIWRKVLAQYGDAGVFTPGPLHLLVLIGVPLWATLATIGNVFAWRQSDPWRLLVRVWCAMNALLIYIPTDYRVHMLSGWQIPLGLLASEGIYTRLWPGIRARLPQLRGPQGVALGILLLLALTVPTNLYLVAWRVLVLQRSDHEHFLYRDEIEALGWIQANGHAGDVVLASVTLDQFVPTLTDMRPYAGHWAQTVDFSQRRRDVAAFFQTTTTPAERARILHQCRVRYVLHGRGERELGGFDPQTSAMLTPVFRAGPTAVYRVNSPTEDPA